MPEPREDAKAVPAAEVKTEAEQVDRDEIVRLAHDGQIGTFETTRGALEDVWSQKGWRVATEEDITKADKLAAEQA